MFFQALFRPRFMTLTLLVLVSALLLLATTGHPDSLALIIPLGICLGLVLVGIFDLTQTTLGVRQRQSGE